MYLASNTSKMKRQIIKLYSKLKEAIGITEKFELIISIDDDGLFLNSRKINKDAKPDIVKMILGIPDRISLKMNTIWTYDNLGIMVYLNPEGNSIKQVTLVFEKDDLDFIPNKTFRGKLLLFGNNIFRVTPLSSLKNIKALIHDKPVLSHIAESSSYLKLYFHSINNTKSLEKFTIQLNP